MAAIKDIVCNSSELPQDYDSKIISLVTRLHCCLPLMDGLLKTRSKPRGRERSESLVKQHKITTKRQKTPQKIQKVTQKVTKKGTKTQKETQKLLKMRQPQFYVTFSVGVLCTFLHRPLACLCPGTHFLITPPHSHLPIMVMLPVKVP